MDLEHPDITSAMRTGYPRGGGITPSLPILREYEGNAFPYEGEDEENETRTNRKQRTIDFLHGSK